MSSKLRSYMQKNDGVASVAELASFLGVDEGYVRTFARARGLRRIGSTYAFTPAAAQALERRVKYDYGEVPVDHDDVDDEEEFEEDADDLEDEDDDFDDEEPDEDEDDDFDDEEPDEDEDDDFDDEEPDEDEEDFDENPDDEDQDDEDDDEGDNDNE